MERFSAFSPDDPSKLAVLKQNPVSHSVPHVLKCTVGLQALFAALVEKSKLCVVSHVKNTEQPYGCKLEPFDDNNGFLVLPDSNNLRNFTFMAGRYSFIKLIGRGTFAQIIQAKDEFTSSPIPKHVAIKITRAGMKKVGTQESNLHLFLAREPEFKHCHIAVPIASFIYQQHVCLVLELLGDPLSHVLRSLPAFSVPVSQIRKLSWQLCIALAFLSSKGVIHADVRSENVMLYPNSCNVSEVRQDQALKLKVKLADLGNSFLAQNRGIYYDDFELQTLSYRSPEVLFGMNFDCQIDMWSLGCLLVEVYIGRQLFNCHNRGSLASIMVKTLGPIPPQFRSGKFANQLEGQVVWGTNENENLSAEMQRCKAKLYLKCKLAALLQCDEAHDLDMIDFFASLLTYDPAARLSAAAAFSHPFLVKLCPVALVLQASRPVLAPQPLKHALCDMGDDAPLLGRTAESCLQRLNMLARVRAPGVFPLSHQGLRERGRLVGLKQGLPWDEAVWRRGSQRSCGASEGVSKREGADKAGEEMEGGSCEGVCSGGGWGGEEEEGERVVRERRRVVESGASDDEEACSLPHAAPSHDSCPRVTLNVSLGTCPEKEGRDGRHKYGLPRRDARDQAEVGGSRPAARRGRLQQDAPLGRLEGRRQAGTRRDEAVVKGEDGGGDRRRLEVMGDGAAQGQDVPGMESWAGDEAEVHVGGVGEARCGQGAARGVGGAGEERGRGGLAGRRVTLGARRHEGDSLRCGREGLEVVTCHDEVGREGLEVVTCHDEVGVAPALVSGARDSDSDEDSEDSGGESHQSEAPEAAGGGGGDGGTGVGEAVRDGDGLGKRARRRVDAGENGREERKQGGTPGDSVGLLAGENARRRGGEGGGERTGRVGSGGKEAGTEGGERRRRERGAGGRERRTTVRERRATSAWWCT